MTEGKRRTVKIAGVVALCGALGAGGAYIGSSASPSDTSAAAGKDRRGADKRDGHRRGGLRPLRRAVHLEAVVPAQGGKFVTVTVDRGIVEKVDGTTLTLKEGTPRATYKTVSLDIPSGAVVRINRQPGKLSDVKAGQRAIVVHGPTQTRVLVRDARGGPQP